MAQRENLTRISKILFHVFGDIIIPDGDERIQNGLPYGVRLSLRHAPQVPNFLPQILGLFLQASQLIVHFRCQRHVPINVLAGNQRCRFRRRGRFMPVSLCNVRFDSCVNDSSVSLADFARFIVLTRVNIRGVYKRIPGISAR